MIEVFVRSAQKILMGVFLYSSPLCATTFVEKDCGFPVYYLDMRNLVLVDAVSQIDGGFVKKFNKDRKKGLKICDICNATEDEVFNTIFSYYFPQTERLTGSYIESMRFLFYNFVDSGKDVAKMKNVNAWLYIGKYGGCSFDNDFTASVNKETHKKIKKSTE